MSTLCSKDLQSKNLYKNKFLGLKFADLQKPVWH